jgi:hypothetical protein
MSPPKKVSLGDLKVPPKNVKLNSQPHNYTISFSYKYYNQIKDFGMEGAADIWISSLLARQKELSSFNPKSLTEFNRHFRLHPISLKDKSKMAVFEKLDLPAHLATKEQLEESGISQIAISKGNGRLIGFFGAENYDRSTFYILFIDKNHNLYPNENFENILPNKLNCMFSNLVGSLDEAIQNNDKINQDGKLELKKIIKNSTIYGSTLILVLTKKEIEQIKEIYYEGEIDAIKELLLYGLGYCENAKQ